MLGRIDLGEPVGQNGDGSTARLNRPAMRGRVDAAGQARDDGEARSGPARRPAARRSAHAVGRAPARADQRDRQLVARLERPAGVEQAGRVGDLGQRRRIARVAAGDQVDAPRAAEIELRPGRRARCGPGRSSSATLGPTPGTSRRLATEASRIPPRRLEPLEQRPAGERPDTGDHGQHEQVAELRFGKRWGCVQSGLLRRHHCGAGVE